MGGAASKDFLEGGPRTAVAKELDELGGYDRPALAKNQSFTARLDWLGTQVGKTSEQIEAALSKDEQAGRRELEKEAKRRQLMALRRGQGDIQMNLQYVDFYLRQKQYERGPVGSSASILRNSHVAALAAEAVEASDASSARMDAMRRTSEQVATLQRLYSSKSGPGAIPPGPRPDTGDGSAAPKSTSSAGGNSKWRQTVQHAKKTAFLAVGTYVAMNGKKRAETARIENLALFAEQQLGEGVHKFVEEGEKLAVAREKLPDMKAELENLRTAMRQMAVEQQELEASCPPEVLDAPDGEEDESEGATDNDGVDVEEAAAMAAAAAAAMRHPKQKAATPSNKPRWHVTGTGHGFESLSSYPRARAARLRDAPASAPPGGPSSSASVSHSAPLPTVGSSHAAAAAAPPVSFTTARRRVTVAAAAASNGAPGSAAGVTISSNGSLQQPPPLLRQSSHGQVSGPLQPLGAGPGALNGMAVKGPSGSGRLSMARASWSGGTSQPDLAVTHGGGGAAADAFGSSLAGVQQHGTGAPLRPSRPNAPGAAMTPGMRASAPALAAGAAGGPVRPASPVRLSLLGLGPRPPSSAGGSPVSLSSGRPGTQKTNGDSPRMLPAEAPTTPGEHRVGTMAMRIASKVTLPLRIAKHQLRALRDAETANVLRQQQLLQAIEENASILQSSSGLLNMYCNRANGRWVEMQQWGMPAIHEAALPAVRRQAERYREAVLKDLREGRVAVQIHVDDDVFLSARLRPLAMWSVDPWQLLALTHPARTEWTSHLVGLGLGVRQLLALASAVEAAAGPEALAKMQVVVACHEGQVEAVVRDLTARKMCRFDPDNVIISVQQRTPGHTYDKGKHGFVPAPNAPLRAAGSGYALLSLCWAGSEAFRLGGSDPTARRPLERSAMDTFLEKGVTWLSSWRLRDMVHFSPDSCLNIEQLMLSYALADSIDANMSMQVELVESLHGISRNGAGIVLSLKERVTLAPPPPPPTAAANVALLRRNGRATAPHHPASAHPHSNTQSQGGAQTHGSNGTHAAAAAAAGAGPPAPTTPSGGAASSASMRAASGNSASDGGGGPSANAPADSSPPPPSSTSSPAPATPSPPTQPQPQPPSHPQPPTPPRPLNIPPQRHHASAPPSPAPPPTGTGMASSRHSLDHGGGGGGSGGGSRRSLVSSGSRVGGIGTEGGPLPVCDIKWADVQTPALASGLQQLVESAAAQMGTTPRVAVSIKRYMYHLPSLKAILTGPGIFRPSVSVGEGGYLYVTFDASDITAQPAARCVALSYGSRSTLAATTSAKTLAAAAAAAADGADGASAAGGNTNNAISTATAQAAQAAMQRGRLLTNDSDLDTLLWVMAEQDNHPGFRASVSATNTARSRVTSHAAGGVAGAIGVSGPVRMQIQQRIIVVAVTDDVACPLAVKLSMAIMKPGADCLHVLSIAKDPSAMAVAAARAVAERFETMAAATLGEVKSVVQVKRSSIVEDIAAYAELVRATLLVTGSMSLAAAQGSSVVGSVALSLARDCGRPILVVKPTVRSAETAYEVGKKPCLRAALAAETGSRPMVRFVVDHVLDGTRGDKLVLIRGKAFDKDMQELSSSRRIVDHLAEEATSNRRFDSSLVVRRMVPNAFESEYQRVADADQCHIVGVQVPECRGPLPASVTQMLRSCRSAVLVYRTSQGKAAPSGLSSTIFDGSDTSS